MEYFYVFLIHLNQIICLKNVGRYSAVTKHSVHDFSKNTSPLAMFTSYYCLNLKVKHCWIQSQLRTIHRVEKGLLSP